jgi:hypothetical protein
VNKHEVRLTANRSTFVGLSRQNLLFHQCLGELVDNAIAATPADQKFRIDIILKQADENSVDTYVIDNCSGMDLCTLETALQLGRPATTGNRLNEHGFGLKHALATMSGGNGPWDLWTRSKASPTVLQVKGPFDDPMYIDVDVKLPDDLLIPSDWSTIIRVRVPLAIMQSVQGRGAKAQSLDTLRWWLVEHLGVMYRGYLDLDPISNEPCGSISLVTKDERWSVAPVHVPFSSTNLERFDLSIGGEKYTLEYTYGTLDTVKRDKLIRDTKAKYYYQGNQPTQGIDIRLGRRVIATRLFNEIWRGPDGTPLSRHNDYNDFVGEL